MLITKIRGIIIGEQSCGESNKKLEVLGKDLGRIFIFAKGAKNIKGPFLAGTQLFCYCDFLVVESRGFYSLTQVDLIEQFYGISLDMEKLAETVYMGELISKTCPIGTEQDEVLRLFLDTLWVLEKGILQASLISRIFEVKYLQISGFLPEFACVICGQDEGTMYFHKEQGIFLCWSHRIAGEEIPLLSSIATAISFIMCHNRKEIFGFYLSSEALIQLDQIMESYFKIHLGIYLKSRAFSKGL